MHNYCVHAVLGKYEWAPKITQKTLKTATVRRASYIVSNQIFSFHYPRAEVALINKTSSNIAGQFICDITLGSAYNEFLD